MFSYSSSDAFYDSYESNSVDNFLRLYLKQDLNIRECSVERIQSGFPFISFFERVRKVCVK